MCQRINNGPNGILIPIHSSESSPSENVNHPKDGQTESPLQSGPSPSSPPGAGGSRHDPITLPSSSPVLLTSNPNTSRRRISESSILTATNTTLPAITTSPSSPLAQTGTGRQLNQSSSPSLPSSASRLVRTVRHANAGRPPRRGFFTVTPSSPHSKSQRQSAPVYNTATRKTNISSPTKSAFLRRTREQNAVLEAARIEAWKKQKASDAEAAKELARKRAIIGEETTDYIKKKKERDKASLVIIFGNDYTSDRVPGGVNVRRASSKRKEDDRTRKRNRRA